MDETTDFFAVPIDTKTYASIRFMSICPSSHFVMSGSKGQYCPCLHGSNVTSLFGLL